MVPFDYRKITKIFLDELKEKVLNGESILMLGPRFVGKRTVMNSTVIITSAIRLK